MNDRYLYRAKRKNWRELPKEMRWVEGYLYGIWERRYILWNYAPNMVEVDPSTICQCTGLKDKNDKLIWENDVVKGKYYDNGKSHRHIGQVKYIYEAYKVVGVKQYTGYHAHLDGSYEVIGNIFDNKELLESEDKDESNY